MFKIDGKVFRNIQEQVEENKKQIEGFENIQFVLNNFGITVLGVVAIADDIPEQDYEYGDAWLIGTEPPYDMYVYTRDNTPGSDGTFVNLGQLAIEGPTGPAGTIQVGTVTTGDAGTQVVITNSGTMSNAVLNFTIPKGDKGATGNGIYTITKTATEGLVDTYTVSYTDGTSTTFTVTNGRDGKNGQDGDPGESFMIMGVISNTSLLPDPSITPRNHAYVLNDGDASTPDKLYYITGEAGSEVWNYSSFAAAGTTVSVNGNPTYAWNADTKLDKVASSSGASQVYTKNTDGTQAMKNYGTARNSLWIVQRDENSQLYVPETPTQNYHAASKKYVDDRTTDYITEEGTSGIWTYRKWASGKKECWGTYETTSSIVTAWGTLYVSAVISPIAYPFTFNTIPVEVCRATNIESYSVFTVADAYNTTSATGKYSACRPNQSGEMHLKYQIYVIGY